MRSGMRAWIIVIVAAPGIEAANEPLAAFARRREVVVTRQGGYTRVVLRVEDASPLPLRPEWA
jgi:hypothetical protein